MRRWTTAVLAAAAAALTLPVPASAAPSAPVGEPVLTGVTLSTGSAGVKGLGTVPVTVTVTATGDAGRCPGTTGGVSLRRTSTRVWDRSATWQLVGPLSCRSESGGVRTYSAVVPVPSTADGAWRVDAVSFANTYYLDPRTFGLPDATLAVTGTHRPRLRISVAPQPLVTPARDVRVTVQASYDDTRAPVTTRHISITDDGGSLGPCGRCPGTTDAHGRIVRRLALTDFRQVIADMPISAPGFYDFWPSYSSLAVPIVVQPVLAAAPASNSARHGTDVGVDGRAAATAVRAWYFNPRVLVVLQRLVGRHWRSVGQGSVRPNGRFGLVATPPRGRNSYRVALPAQQGLAAAASRTFIVRGT